MSRLLLPLIVAGLIARSGVASADEAVNTIDETQFVAALEAADPRLQRLAAEVDVARADAAVAGLRPNPSVAFDREHLFPDGGGAATNYVRLSYPLDVSGRRSRQIDAARAATAATAADADAARFAIIVDGLRVFNEAAYARLRVELSHAERDTLVRAVDVVRTRAGAGATSGYDLQRFELELAAYDDAIASAETQLFELRARLAALVGRAEQLDAVSSLALPATPALVDAEMASVLEGRSDLRAAQLRAKSADHRARAAARGWIPDLGLSAGVMMSDVGDETALGYTVGLTFALPIFDRGGALGAQARASRRVANAEARVIEAQVTGAVHTRRTTLARRIEQSQAHAATQLARLPGLLRAAETGYREGASGVVELLDAYQTARDARLRDLELRRDARLAELDLWLALGRRL